MSRLRRLFWSAGLRPAVVRFAVPVAAHGTALWVKELGKGLKTVRTAAYAAMGQIHFDGAFFRRDIANKSLTIEKELRLFLSGRISQGVAARLYRPWRDSLASIPPPLPDLPNSESNSADFSYIRYGGKGSNLSKILQYLLHAALSCGLLLR